MKISIKLLLVSLCFIACKKGNLPVQDSLTENNKATNPHSPKYIPQVKIGKQTWTLLNLDVSTYANGDIIPEVTDAAQWAALTTGAWCYYDNDPAIGAVYGKLYNWYAVADPRGLAPKGWHVPSDAEWVKLENYLGGSDLAGGAIGYADGTNSTNSSGFTGLPGGSRDFDGTFIYLYYNSNWWSSTADGATNAFGRGYSWIGTSLGRPSVGKQFGFYVRCVK